MEKTNKAECAIHMQKCWGSNQSVGAQLWFRFFEYTALELDFC